MDKEFEYFKKEIEKILNKEIKREEYLETDESINEKGVVGGIEIDLLLNLLNKLGGRIEQLNETEGIR